MKRNRWRSIKLVFVLAFIIILCWVIDNINCDPAYGQFESPATGAGLSDQAVKGDHVDSTSEDFVFNDAFRIKSSTDDSMFMTKKYIDDMAGGLVAQSVKGDHVDSTSEDFVFNDAFRITSAQAESIFITKNHIEKTTHDSLNANWATWLDGDAAESEIHDTTATHWDEWVHISGDEMTGALYLLNSSDVDADPPFQGYRRKRDGNPTDDVSSGDYLGSVYFFGYHTDGYDVAAEIRVTVDGTCGNTDMPGRIELLTSPDASATPVKRMAIKENGDIFMGDGAWTNYIKTTAAGVLTMEGTATIDGITAGNIASEAEIHDTTWAHLDDTSAVLWTAIHDTAWMLHDAIGDTLWAHLDDTSAVLWTAIHDTAWMLRDDIHDTMYANAPGYSTNSEIHDSLYADTLTKSFVIQDPATTHDFPFWMTPNAITLIACNGVCISGTNVVGCLMEYDNDAANPVVCNSSDWTFTTGEERTTSLSNASIDAGDYLGWKTTSVSGDVDFVTITIEYTRQ